MSTWVDIARHYFMVKDYVQRGWCLWFTACKHPSVQTPTAVLFLGGSAQLSPSSSICDLSSPSLALFQPNNTPDSIILQTQGLCTYLTCLPSPGLRSNVSSGRLSPELKLCPPQHIPTSHFIRLCLTYISDIYLHPYIGICVYVYFYISYKVLKIAVKYT
jgi:hypothetical protein